MRLEVDVLPGLGLHQILAGDVGDVLLDLGGVTVTAAEGVGTEVVLRLGEELVEGGTAARAGEAALSVDHDGVLNDVAGLEHGLEAEGGGGGIAAGVGDELLALGQLAVHLGHTVDGVMGHLRIGVLVAVPLLPDLHIAEADVRADVDDAGAFGENDLRPLGDRAGGDLDHHDVALAGGLAHVLLGQIQDGLIIEAAQGRMMGGDGVAHAVGIENVDELAVGMVDHHAQHFAADIAGRTDAGIMDHGDSLLKNFLRFATTPSWACKPLRDSV